VQNRPLKPLSRHFAPQPVVLNELTHTINNQWKARSLVYVHLTCIPALNFHSIRTKRAYASEQDTSPALKTHLKLTKTLKVYQAKQEPAMISNHLVVCQEKTANTFFVWPLVIKILLIVHFLNFTFQYQPILDPDVPLLRLVSSLPVLKDPVIFWTQKAILAQILELTHIPLR
jgi:hypothetical protein